MSRIIVLVDDRKVRDDLVSQRGLSIYVETDDAYLLFDLGPNGEVLQHNAEKLDMDLDLIDAAVISHVHSDHVGGLSVLGWISPFLNVYVPYDSMDGLGRMVKANGLVPREVLDWQKISRNIYITKPLHGPPWEHFLVLERNNGVYVLSGCMHPGIDRVLSTVANYFEKKVIGVIGGFHLENAPPKIVEQSVNKLVNMYDPELIIPLHCSGEYFRSILRRYYPEKYVEGGAGLVYEL